MRSKHPLLFLSTREKEKIVQAIREAEKETSGEIRVHLARGRDKEVLPHAKEIFEKIGMTKTQHRNGVLIFLAVQDKRFCVIGDQGIHEKVPAHFWNEMIHRMQTCFKENRFAEGIVEAVLMTGKKLQEYFPSQRRDENELPDRISYSR